MNGFRNIDTYEAALLLTNNEFSYFTLYNMIDETLTLGNFADVGQELLDELGDPGGMDYGRIDWEEIFEQFIDA